MSDRLTAEPGTLEFQRQFLGIARESDHTIDKALVRVLSKRTGKMERLGLGASEIEKAALHVVSAWNNERISLPNAMGRLACMLEMAGYEIERTVPNPRLEKLSHKVIRQFWEMREAREARAAGMGDGS